MVGCSSDLTSKYFSLQKEKLEQWGGQSLKFLGDFFFKNWFENVKSYLWNK